MLNQFKICYYKCAFLGAIFISILSDFCGNFDIWSIERAPYLFGLLCAVYGIGLLFFLFFRRRNLLLNLGIIDVLLITYFLYILFSSLILNGELFQLDKIYPIFGYLICYFVFGFFIRDPKNKAVGINALFWIVSAQGIYGLLQYFQVLKSASNYFAITGSYLNPAMFAAFISVGVSSAFYLLKVTWYKKRLFYLYLFFLLVLLIVLLLSKSRTAYLSSFSGALITVLFLFKDRIAVVYKPYKKIVWLSLICLIFACIFYLVQLNSASLVGRILIWKVSIKMACTNPVFGLGLGQYSVQYGFYQASFFKTEAFDPIYANLAGMNYYPFNEFLKILIENGMIGLLLFLFVVSFTIYCLFRSITIYGNEKLIPYTGILISLLIFAQSSYPFEQISISSIFILILALGSVAEKQLLPKRVVYYNVNINYIYVIGFLLLFFVYGAWQKIMAINTWKSAQQNILIKEKSSFGKYQDIYSVLSKNASFLFNYGAELFNVNSYGKSIFVLNRAYKYGNHYDIFLYLGDAHRALKEYKQAEEEYLLAHYMVPNLFVPLDKLLGLYIENGQHVRALAIANIIVKKHVKVPSEEVKNIIRRAQLFIEKR